jgi:protein pelota
LKIIEKNVHKGYVKLIPDSADDLWTLYNVINKNDEVYTYSSRAIKTDQEYSRPKSGERVSAFIGVKVDEVTWDKLLGKLRVHGIICHAPEIIPQGAHHTLSISLHQPLTIVKNEWSKHALERIDRATENEKPILILAIDDEGYAVAETRQYGVEIKIEECTKLPGKLEADKRSTATKAYFNRALKSLQQLWIPHRSPIVVLGVGFIKNDFAKHLAEEDRTMAESVADVKSVNSGVTAGIYEALRSGLLLRAARQLRIVEETEIVEEIMKRLGKGDNMVAYGIEDVTNALQFGAIEKLVIADTLLRESSDDKRRQLEQLMNETERRNGRISVISTEHEAGLKLTGLGGIAGLLRFSLKY